MSSGIREKYNEEIVKKVTQVHDFLLQSTTDYLNDLGTGIGSTPQSLEIFVYQYLLTYVKSRDFFYEVLMKLEKDYGEMLLEKIKEKAKAEGII